MFIHYLSAHFHHQFVHAQEAERFNERTDFGNGLGFFV